MNDLWKIWIDTGGTFSDCIALSPAGQSIRAKVLSKGCLRGRLTDSLGDCHYKLEQRWGEVSDIFEGYRLALLDTPDQSFNVVATDLAAGAITLDRELPSLGSFEISAGEEAPVLAARLVTGTPLARPLPPMEMRIGTTKGTNALLERKGAKVTLITTKGLGDLPAIGTQQRPNLFQLDIPEPRLLHTQVIEVEERIAATGEILTPLSDTEIHRVVAAIEGDSVAISLLNSYRNPAHEIALAEAISLRYSEAIATPRSPVPPAHPDSTSQPLNLSTSQNHSGAIDSTIQRFNASTDQGHSEATPTLTLTPSHSLSPTLGLLARTQTAIVNAYLEPILNAYLANIRRHFTKREGRLLVMTSAGGLVDADAFRAKDSLLSGPAGGVVGAAAVARQCGIEKVITLDMGGTSTDTARYHGRYDYQFTTSIGEATLRSPALAIETVASGGGSICAFDGYRLTVGPDSAGASPGPACYGAGGPLTITDVNLLLGKLDPGMMGIPIESGRAREALEAVKSTILARTGEHYTDEALLRGFEQIANEKMADAIKRISVARGFDPAEYHLLAFGGAGGLHACRIAELLQMQGILLPYEGGLLSAYGIGRARIERFAEQQVLQNLADCKPQLPQHLEALAAKATDQLLADGYGREEICVDAQLAFLRFKGQHHALEIPIEALDTLETQFEAAYRRLFGYYPQHLAIEVESLRVLAVVEEKHPVLAPEKTNQMEAGTARDIPVWQWDTLPQEAVLQGPGILLNRFATAYVAPGWQLSLTEGRHVLLHRIENNNRITTDDAHGEATALELFTHRFGAIAEEMGAQLQRTAFSVNIKERLDFSCALLDPDGRLLVNAPHIPVHLGSLGICTRLVKEALPLGPGDIAITNHPGFGGSHLPDITLVGPVHTADGRLIGYIANRAHHAEIGGKRPGSMPPDAQNLAEEGVVFAPMYVAKNGVVDWEPILKRLQAPPFPTRMYYDNLADLNAALASFYAGADALRQLADTFGLDTLHHYMRALKDHAAAAIREALQPYSGNRYTAEEYLDDGWKIQVALEISEDAVTIDFSGSSGVHSGNLNANISIVYSAVIYVLRLLCRREVPLNEGLMELVRITLPENSFLHPVFPADPTQCPAVVGGNTEVSQRLVDTLLKALGLAACSQGTMNNFLFGNDRFGYYETIGGGTGAGPGFHGRSAVHQHMTNTRITDPEELEWRYPVRLRRFAIRCGSGGQGQYHGGDGIIREVEFLEPMEITILSQHRVQAPYGLHGGRAGATGRQYLLRATGEVEPLAATDSKQVGIGDRVVVETPGGGGVRSGEL